MLPSQLAFLVAILLVGTLAGAGCSPAGSPPKYAGTRRVQFPSTRCQLVIQNPRKLGEREFYSADGRSYGSRRSSPTDREMFRYEVRVVPLVRLNSGKVVSPVVVERRARREGGSQLVLSQVTTYADTIYGGYIGMPRHPSLQSHVLLLKTNQEETGYRVFEIDPAKASGEIVVPDLLTLPSVVGHPDEQAFLEAYQAAVKEWQPEVELQGFDVTPVDRWGR